LISRAPLFMRHLFIVLRITEINLAAFTENATELNLRSSAMTTDGVDYVFRKQFLWNNRSKDEVFPSSRLLLLCLIRNRTATVSLLLFSMILIHLQRIKITSFLKTNSSSCFFINLFGFYSITFFVGRLFVVKKEIRTIRLRWINT
jgi:hypothetical protein